MSRIRSLVWRSVSLCQFCVFILLFSAGKAEPPRVLPKGSIPHDSRLGELRTLDSYFPMEVPESPEAWARHAELTRRRIQVANGLFPLPERTPARAVVHGLVERDDFTVERVYLESYPGHFVTGSLFRPRGRAGRLPGVLCPHGHWANGRFYDAGDEGAQREIDSGAETLLSAAHHPLQARCVQLARMGCVVFHYDMVGYADSQQIGPEVAHRFSERRPHMEQNDAWGFFTPQAELRLQSIMGLQTYNSVRVLDWFSALPDVDSQRIGVTGASGGGTQTFILCAIDPRPVVEFPAVMVSTAMQGGCTCENATYLRIGVGNIDFAGCFAPKPLGMSAADDWTKEIATKGLPELQKLYALMHEPDHVMAAPFLQFGHNYNAVSRAVMYDWFNRYLHLGVADTTERDFVPLSREELTVWDDAHPRPAGGEDYERSLTRTMADAADAALATDPDRFTRNAYEVIIGRGVPASEEIKQVNASQSDNGSYIEFASLLQLPSRGEEVPVLFLMPKEFKHQLAIWVDGRGKQALFTDAGEPQSEIARLLAAGWGVGAVDVFQQGEFLEDPAAKIENRQVNNHRNFAAYTYGYNDPLFVQRVHDVLTVIGRTRRHAREGDRVHLVGLHGAGIWVAAAASQAGDAVERVAIDTEGFRFANLTSYVDPQFLPGAVKYGDVPGLLNLISGRRLWIAGESPESFARWNQKPAAFDGPQDQVEAAVVDWLLK